LASGLGTGAFGVLLLRLTEKRFSATQYALLSTLFTIPRILAGPVAGVSADAFGWRDFFIATVFVGLPGLVMLARFVPWSAREVRFEVAAPSTKPALGKQALALRAFAGVFLIGVISLLSLATVNALGHFRARKVFDLQPELSKLLAPSAPGDWLTLAGVAVMAAVGGLAVAATAQARRAPPASE
jgi:PAT family beta-lactamase induction signal transducer AmpG